jgi:crotonobetainyl-CoA:carnitine CoA-transferase CaiB-like acyl-CoA transferase
VACARALELDLAHDASLRTNAGRISARARVVGAIAARVATGGAAEWRERLDAAGVPCGVVRTVAEVLAGIDVSVVTGMPPSVPGTIRRPPPRLGEHSAAVRTSGWGAFQ